MAIDVDNPTEPSGGASGQASDIAIHAKEILRVRQVLTSIYQRHCAKEGESQADGIARFHFDREMLIRSAHAARARALENTKTFWNAYRAEMIRDLFESSTSIDRAKL